MTSRPSTTFGATTRPPGQTSHFPKARASRRYPTRQTGYTPTQVRVTMTPPDETASVQALARPSVVIPTLVRAEIQRQLRAVSHHVLVPLFVCFAIVVSLMSGLALYATQRETDAQHQTAQQVASMRQEIIALRQQLVK
jgi:hypothetical protein